jgi:ABC-2 type transport system permease protein
MPNGDNVTLIKDLKVFLRDTAQWSQLLLLLALAVVYVYNFQVLDLDRVPYMGFVIRNLYAFLNLLMAAFVLSAVAVRFVFPAVSAEGGPASTSPTPVGRVRRRPGRSCTRPPSFTCAFVFRS